MKCKKCLLAKGIKFFSCKECGKESSNYMNGVDYCPECIEKMGICQICGKLFIKALGQKG